MAVVKINEYGNKFNFNNIKVGDTVVITSTEYSFSNNSEMWPKRSYFQLNKVTAVGEDYVEVENKYKFKQAIKYTYYIPLVVNTEKEIEYTDEYLKATRCADRIPPLDGKTYNNNEYGYSKVYEDREGVTSPRYLFPYTEEWEKIIKDCEYDTAQKKKAEEERKIKEQQILEMKKDSKEQYDAIIDPLIKKFEALKEKIDKEKCKAFDKFYCSICANNDDICSYEEEFGWNYYKNINPKTHKDKDGNRYRPIEDCKYFEKEEGK